MALHIAVSNQKGGAGKTTTAINVAGALAHRGHGVFSVDLSALFGLSDSAIEILTTGIDVTFGPLADLVERVVSKIAVLLVGLRSSQPAPMSVPARPHRRAETRRRTPARTSARGGKYCVRASTRV